MITTQQTLTGEIYASPYLDFNTLETDTETLYMASYGGGVNSTAMILHILESGAPLDAILFADTGAEMPETLEYVKLFNSHISKYFRKEIVTVQSKRGTLMEIAKSNNIIPRPASTKRRWCTKESKITPIRQKCRKIMRQEKKRKLVMYIGIDAGESQRIRPADAAYITNCYPLIDLDFSRRMCIETIKKHNLPEPIKSGCYFCEYQSVNRWESLYQKHPDLYQLSVDFEKQAFNRKTGEPEFFNFRRGKAIPLTKLADAFKHQTKISIDTPNNDSCGGECFN